MEQRAKQWTPQNVADFLNRLEDWNGSVHCHIPRRGGGWAVTAESREGVISGCGSRVCLGLDSYCSPLPEGVAGRGWWAATEGIAGAVEE